jgi:hypothetical protein
MCISLRLITNINVGDIFFQQTAYAEAQLNATVCHFADIISLRRRHILLGPFRDFDEILNENQFHKH